MRQLRRILLSVFVLVGLAAACDPTKNVCDPFTVTLTPAVPARYNIYRSLTPGAHIKGQSFATIPANGTGPATFTDSVTRGVTVYYVATAVTAACPTCPALAESAFSVEVKFTAP